MVDNVPKGFRVKMSVFFPVHQILQCIKQRGSPAPITMDSQAVLLMVISNPDGLINLVPTLMTNAIHGGELI